MEDVTYAQKIAVVPAPFLAQTIFNFQSHTINIISVLSMLRIIITVYGLYIGVATCHRSRVSSGDTNEVIVLFDSGDLIAVEQHNDTSDSEEVIRANVLEIKGNANTGYGNQTANAEDPIFAKVFRGPGDIGPNQVFFRPCLVYQEINADHVCDDRLELRVDFESGKNTA